VAVKRGSSRRPEPSLRAKRSNPARAQARK
jgi:hypothetical protein